MLRGNKRRVKHARKNWLEFTPPGFNFTGPGNSMDRTPTNADDYQAVIHDNWYNQLMYEGMNPYTTWNAADEHFIQNVGHTPMGVVAGGIFRAKKKLDEYGLLPTHTKHVKHGFSKAEPFWYHFQNGSVLTKQ